jgi:tripartite-type tricarboxylate transporter receptor subunit TctC
MRSKIMIFCLAMIAIVIAAASAWSQDFFKGKAIQIIMGYPTGGGVDAEARLLAKYFERYLPGNPAVTVRNMPGAAGLVAANWFEQFAKPDGLYLHYGSSTNIVEQAFARAEVKYNLLNWDLVGAILRGTPVAVMRPDKIDRLKSGKPLAIGSRSGEDTWNAMFLWGAEYLKWNVRWVLGYGGGGEMRLAFQRGETDIYATSNLVSLKELISEGFQPFVQKGRLLADGSSKKRVEFPKVPLFDELLGAQKPTGVSWQAYITVAGADDSGRPLHTAKKTPPEIAKVYRDTMARIEKDKEFSAELAKVAGDDAEVLSSAESEPVLRRLLTLSPGAKEFASKMMKKYLNR